MAFLFCDEVALGWRLEESLESLRSEVVISSIEKRGFFSSGLTLSSLASVFVVAVGRMIVLVGGFVIGVNLGIEGS